MTYLIECSQENAEKFREWIATRGGVATWKSVNLGNPSGSWSTPALTPEGKPTPKPTWECANEPTIVTDPAQVGVYTEVLYKAFPVALKRGSGFSFNLTDGAQRKLAKAMRECREKHGDAFYRPGVLDIDGASMGVYYPSVIVALSDVPTAVPA